MPTASALLAAFPAGRESAFHSQTGPPVARRVRPVNDLLALSERPAGVIAVTAINAGGAAGAAAGALTDEDQIDLGKPVWKR